MRRHFRHRLLNRYRIALASNIPDYAITLLGGTDRPHRRGHYRPLEKLMSALGTG